MSYYLIIFITLIGIGAEVYILGFTDRRKVNLLNKICAIISHIAIWSGGFFSAWFTAFHANKLDVISYICLAFFITGVAIDLLYCIFSKLIYNAANKKKV